MSCRPRKIGDCAKFFGASLVVILNTSSAFADGSVTEAGASSGIAAPGAAIPGAALPQPLAGADGPRPDGGIAFHGWMLYPSLFAGGVFNDNVYATPTNRTAAFGLRLTPNFEADLDNGLYKTTVYGTADAQLYPGHNPSLGETASTVSARAGLAQIWSPTSDIVTRFNVDYTRQDSPFGSTLITGAPIGSATSFIGAPVALNVYGFRQFTDQTTGNLSVQKNVTDQIFVRIGIGAQQLIYESPPTGFVSAQNSVDYNAFIRGGFWVTPQVAAFVETGGDLRRYNSSSFYDTNNYRVIGGLASDMIGLFRGEVYGGMQEQLSARGVFSPLIAPAYGARLTYYPTRYLNIAASVDNNFGSAGAATSLSPVSANTQTLQARLQADYAMFQSWKASARGGFADTRYYGSSASNQAWLGGFGVSYSIWRNLGLTLDYQYTNSTSNGLGALSYSDNLVSAGVNYRY